MKNIHEFAKKNNLSLEKASNKMLEQNLIKPKAKLGLNLFLNLLNKWRNISETNNCNHIKYLSCQLVN